MCTAGSRVQLRKDSQTSSTESLLHGRIHVREGSFFYLEGNFILM